MKRLCYIIGTRPEVIRSAGIFRAFEQHAEVRVDLVNTGQHFDPEMMSLLMDEVGLPHAARTIVTQVSHPGRRFATMINALIGTLEEQDYDGVVVYGDTDSALAGALAAVKMRIPVVHVEAGCRSGDLRMQEELNRRLIDHASALQLAVSENCLAHLQRESAPGVAVLTGDPQYDVFLQSRPATADTLDKAEGFVTMHRAENVDDPVFLRQMIGCLGEYGEQEDVMFVWAVHPRTASFFANETPSEFVRVVSPLPYGDTLEHLGRSTVCVTDSGGLQKEAFWLQVPCVTMRESTEWTETVEAGANVLCSRPSDLVDAIAHVVAARRTARWAPDPYGGPGSAERVASAIVHWLSDGARVLLGEPSVRGV